jgi:hypothetical protein
MRSINGEWFRQKINSVKAFIVTHKPLALLVVLIIVALGVNAWRNWDDERNTAPTEEVTEQEDDSSRIHLGWSNLAVLGVLIAALGVVKYKKSLNVNEDINESKGDE